jgi:dTDP-4-dehydrorhamnose reductase
VKVILIGADGQLGSELLKVLAPQLTVIPLYYPEFDVTRPQEARQVLGRLNPDMVINTAAFQRVDECEDNPQAAFQVNSIAVRDLALAARELNFSLVHFSTDYVFDGRKRRPYVEGDPPRPLSVYGVSKLAGEYFLRALIDRYFLIRTCGLYGAAGSREKGYNFVDRMLALAGEEKTIRVVNDQRVTPTSAAELAGRIAELIQTRHYGLYHMTNEGECTWFEFAQEIFRLTGLRPRLQAIDSRSHAAKARRPRYSVLENKRAKELGLQGFSPWPTALHSYLEKKGILA